MRPFNHFTDCMPDYSSTQENTARVIAGIIRQICTAYSTPPLAWSILRAWCKQLVWLCLGYYI